MTYVFWPQDTVFDWKPKEQQGEQVGAAAAAPEGYGTEGEETEDDEEESSRAPAQRKRPKKKAAASR